MRLPNDTNENNPEGICGPSPSHLVQRGNVQKKRFFEKMEFTVFVGEKVSKESCSFMEKVIPPSRSALKRVGLI